MERPSDKIIARIKKLLRLAENEGASPEEAATAAAHAASYMRKYNLDHSDLILEDLKSGESITSEWMPDDLHYMPNRFPQWLNPLATSVARLFDCHVNLSWREDRYADGRRYCNFRFFGYKTDVEVCRWTFSYLYNRIQSLTEAFWASQGRGNARLLKASYRLGASAAIRQKIKAMIEEKNLSEKGSSLSTALVVAKRQAIEQVFGKFDYRKGSGHTEVHGDAYRRGVADGKTISIHTPISTTGAQTGRFLSGPK